MLGPQIPQGRRRGGGGLGVYNGKFYLVGGNTKGHSSGFVSWFDEYNPRTASWTTLADAPRSRDHFHAAILGDSLYAVGGRRTSATNTFGDTIREVDVYDFNSQRWITSGLPDDLPVPRAAAATAVIGEQIMLIGGESGVQKDAFKDVHVLNAKTGKWSTLALLHHGRHGTQAIVSGEGVYVAGGSPIRGGGNQKNMEVYNRDVPTGEKSVAGSLSAPASAEIASGMPRTVKFQHIAGNQGVLVNSVSISGPSSSDFILRSNIADPFLIGVGEHFEALVEYSGSVNGATAQLRVTFSQHQSLQVELLSRTPSTQVDSPLLLAPKRIFVDAGTKDEDNSIITGATYIHGVQNSPPVSGTSTQTYFRTHRWGKNFSYKMNGLVPGTMYQVTLGFCEIWAPNCVRRKRVFSLSLNGKVVEPEVDVFAEAGCFAALTRKYTAAANSQGVIDVQFTGKIENAMVSFIEAKETTRIDETPAPSPGPLSVFVDASANDENKAMVQGETSTYRVGNTFAISGTDTPAYFRSHRFGSSFRYVVDGLTTGKAYQVQLGFAEIWTPNCVVGKRQFDITLNDAVVKSNVDVFAAAGCQTAHTETFQATANAQDSISIGFTGKRENAMVSTIEVVEAPSIANTPSPTPSPAPKPTNVQNSNEIHISNIVLVDASTNQDVVGGLDCQPTACLGNSREFNIRAEVAGGVAASVELRISGPIQLARVENTAPYALFGDISGIYNPRKLPPGSYTVTARPFTASNAGGIPGLAKSVNFVVAN